MTLTPWDYRFWLAGLLIEAILVLVVLKKGAWRRWPFLLALAVFDICHSSVISRFSPQTHYAQYFYIYWYGHALRSLLAIGFLWDIFRAFPELKYVPKRMGLTLLTAGFIVTLGSVFLTTQQHPHLAYKVSCEAQMIRECVTVMWMAAALSLLGSISSLGMGWSLESVNITAGALASGIAAMLCAYYTGKHPAQGHLFDKLQTCTEIAVFLSWIKTLISIPGALLPDSALHSNEPYEESCS